ncbi:ChaN family lipoprotein [Thiohalorhabdus sp. Cl-TMA]|uniref:ChaN family lipoprotein n=1 Tax=Thiohalorhabdus methylotrophus TaxID=3242694 RepID=A0ABV4TXD8_9GAMM
MIRDLEEADIVLVGEEHDSRAHHRAQQVILAALLGRGRVAVGMESFPSSSQKALDHWWRGRTDSFRAFLREVRWFQVWGIDPALYRSLLETVRMHRAPLFGINVPRQWISKVAREGLESLDEGQRDRIGPVAPPSEAYRQVLRESLASHGGDHGAEGFIEAQTAWDAAMAGGLLKAARRHSDSVVVGIVGKGHIQGGHGISRQLRARNGDLEVRTVVPYAPEAEERPPKSSADYAWPMNPDRAGEIVRIGAVLDTSESGPGVGVKSVQASSPADKAGLRAGDRILAINGMEVSGTTLLIYNIRRQQWGGCLRLRIRRGEKQRQLMVTLARPSQDGSPGSHARE